MQSLNLPRSLAVSAWTRLNRIRQHIEAASEPGFAAAGLSPAWFDVLAQVGAHEGLSQGELATRLLVTQGNVSQLVAKLVAAGLVEVRAEGRRRHLHLTAEGWDRRQRTLPHQETLVAASLKALTATEQSELVRLLRKWENSL